MSAQRIKGRTRDRKTIVGDVLCESIYKYAHAEFKIIAIKTNLHSYNFVLSSDDKVEWVAVHNLLNYKLLLADIPIDMKIIKKTQS